MRPRRPLGTTYRGLVILNIGGTIAGALASSALFLFRSQSEPILRFLLPIILPRRGRFHYDPADYYFFASLVVMVTILWSGLTLYAILRKPAEDARIDAALRTKDRHVMRGAPLDPP
jgi:hypothetical protein